MSDFHKRGTSAYISSIRNGRWNPGKINSFFNERYEYNKK